MDLPFSEWSRKEKDEYAKKRMEEMKLKNERYKERYAEVQQDRLKAEEKNSSVTGGKVQKSTRDVVPKKPEREWDRGKSSLDTGDWNPPNYQAKGVYDYPPGGSRRNYSDRRSGRKEETWRREQRSSNASRERQFYNSKGESFSKFHRNEPVQQGSGIMHNESANNYRGRPRARGNKFNGLGPRTFGNSKSGNPRKKYDEHSVSPSCSDTEMGPAKHAFRNSDRMVWHDGGVDEVHRKQLRVEKWVKSLNTMRILESGDTLNKPKEYSSQERKKEFGCNEEKNKKSGFREEFNGKKGHPSREQTQFRNKDKPGQRNNQRMYSNVESPRNKNFVENKVYFSSTKNERIIKRNNLNEETRPRRESDISDRSSSMKESDYRDWEKEKNRTSDSKSSDHSAVWIDEDDEYIPEQKPCLPKLPYFGNCDRDKFFNSTILRYREERRAENVKDGHVKNRRHNREKNKHFSKNLSSSDYENADGKDQNNRKPHLRKSNRLSGLNRFSKTKSESKFESHHCETEIYGENPMENDPMNYQNEKDFNDFICCQNEKDSDFDSSQYEKDYAMNFVCCNYSKFEDSSSSLNNSWNDCDPNPTQQRWIDNPDINQHSPNATNESCLEFTASGLPETKIQDYSNVLWADYVVSEETEESLSVDSVKKNNIYEPSLDIELPDVKSQLEEIKTGHPDSYAFKDVTETTISAAKNSCSDEISETSVVRTCKIVTCEKSEEPNTYDSKQQNFIHAHGSQSKENITVVLEFPVLNKKQMSAGTLDKLDDEENNRDDLDDDAGWSTVDEEEDANEG